MESCTKRVYNKRRPFTKYPMDWIGEVSIARGPTCEGQDSDYDEAHFELL